MHRWSAHAQMRAEQRFGDVDLVSALHAARPAGKRTKAHIRRTCPGSARRWMSRYRGRYFLVSPGRIVFVVEAGRAGAASTIVTVFRLDAR